MKKYLVLGIMSGTSLDGLDLALCQFTKNTFGENERWSFKLIFSQTYEYSKDLVKKLRQAQFSDGLTLIALHKYYGEFIAQKVNEFLLNKPRPLLIASHGHTVFHYPQKRVNFQIGDGAVIASLTNLPVVCDFRSQDIALDGQGAPFVPLGDYYLFEDYELLLNLGGFSNLTIRRQLKGFDICPVNFALNYFARLAGKEYDKDGLLGREGIVNMQLLEQLQNLDYYSKPQPKSLSDHWFYNVFLPVVQSYDIGIEDKLRTIYEHISLQLAKSLAKYQGKVLITGGGVFNKFLIELLREKVQNEIVIPSDEIINFKEAIIFGFLGLLRWLGKTNVFASVTGAKRDTSSGAIYLP